MSAFVHPFSKSIFHKYKLTCHCQKFQWNFTRWMAKYDFRVSHRDLSSAVQGRNIMFRNRGKMSEMLFYFSLRPIPEKPLQHNTSSICLSAGRTAPLPLSLYSQFFLFPSTLFHFFHLLSKSFHFVVNQSPHWVSHKLSRCVHLCLPDTDSIEHFRFARFKLITKQVSPAENVCKYFLQGRIENCKTNTDRVWD